jgi:iron complex outermembrane receptor protein
MKHKLTSLLAGVLALMVLNVLPAMAQNKTVSGKVSDASGNPIAGASIIAKGTTVGTQTDASGAFSFSVPSTATTLVLSSVGYTTIEIAIGTGPVSATLAASAGSLNEVVVVGYGTTRKKDLTGAVASVKEKDFNRGIMTAPDQLIQGKVAGVQVINNSGAPGGATTIRIRGNSSIRTGNTPLIVVDGVPLDGGTARPDVSVNGLNNSPGTNPLNFINPSDIASMDILKDASATAIYGSRGANGVILITTKKGLSGAPKVDIGASVGTSNMMRSMDYMTGDEYRTALKAYNITGGDFGQSVDALDEITQTGITQNYSAAISGGNNDGRYRISLSALNQDGFIKKSGFKKYTAGLSGSYKFLNSKRLSLDVNVLTSQFVEDIVPVTNNAGFQGSLIGQALMWNPTRSMYNADGTPFVEKGSTTVNPVAMNEAYNDQSKTTAVLGSISPAYKITNDLEYRMLYSLNYQSGIRRTEMASWINVQNVEGRGWANISTAELFTQQLTHTLTWVKKWDKLNLNAVGGYEYMKFDRSGTSMSGQDFLTNAVPYTNIMQNSSQGNRSISSYANPISELQSYFGRVTLNYNDRFIITGTMRADGSSKFGSENKYGYFPSFAGAWNVANEEFFNANGLVNNLKVRAGWGKTGNQEFPAGSSQERYSFAQGSFQQANVANPNLKWETSTTINAGIDFAMFNNRLTGTVDWFDKKTTDLLFNFDAIQPAPATKYWINLPGEVSNTGFELTLNGTIIANKDFTWSLGGNIAFLENELNNYSGPTILTGDLNGQGLSGVRGQRMENGMPLNTFYTRRFLGLDASGFSKYEVDANGNDLFFVGNPNPKAVYGITTSLSYKKLSLDINMNGASGHLIYNNTLNGVIPISNLGSRNIAPSLFNGKAVESTANAIAASDRYLEKGDYLKLANASLTYRLGNIGKAIKGANLFLTGQNLFVITNYNGFDPEVNTDKQVDGVPSFGIEYIPYPTSRNIIFGVNFSL